MCALQTWSPPGKKSDEGRGVLIDYGRLNAYNEAHRSGRAPSEITNCFSRLLLPPLRPKLAKKKKKKEKKGKDASKYLTIRDLFEDRQQHEIHLYLGEIHKQDAEGGKKKKGGSEFSDLPTVTRPKIELFAEALWEKSTFKRTPAEREDMKQLLRELWPDELRDKVSPEVIDYLSGTIIAEKYRDRGMVISGNNGLCVLLSGSVRTRSPRHLRLDFDADEYAEAETPPVGGGRKLHVGEWFGALVPYANRKMSSGLMSCQVLSDECWIARIFPGDYERAVARHNKSILSDKIQLVQACPNYRNWSPHLLKILADAITIKRYRRGDVVLTYGKQPDHVILLRTGEVDVYKLLPVYGGTYRRVRVDRLEAGDTFGEASMIRAAPLTVLCVAAADRCEIGCLAASKCGDLGPTVRALLEQFTADYGHLDMAAVKRTMLQQECDKDWSRGKSQIVTSLMRRKNIMHGIGKWSGTCM